MAELVFSAAGNAVGSALLPNGVSLLGQQLSGAAIGQFVGSAAGAAFDASLMAKRVEGPRLSEVYVTDSREGVGIPIVYGRARIGGNVIWAANFKEHTQEQGGGKGGPTSTTYSYSLSFAVGLCEGEIARVSRVWANGEALDLATVNMRFYGGTEDQMPDALIEAIEGSAPAYRGLSYVVFEDMPLDNYGARMPQLSFEVVRRLQRAERDVPRMEESIESLNLIPASGEFVYATTPVRRVVAEGEEIAENVHMGGGETNFIQSLEQAISDLPNLKHVNLIVGWFGDDLRTGYCKIRPGVETRDKITKPLEWRVSGQTRESAYLISQTGNGRANYGGTPDDESVLQAIAALKARGIGVTLYPFLFMDVVSGNGLPDPYGSGEQAAFPWRGRIRSMPSDEMTPQAAGDIATFFGSVSAADFNGLAYIGPEDWSYRRFILHYAQLAKQAGGVESLLIGAEMVSLTQTRSARGVYPAVDAFVDLAAEVRAILGNDGTKISYAADWTEYGSHVPNDGSNDVAFPLDALWASDDIDYVGVDWYPPMSDWRHGEDHLDAQAGYASIYEEDYLRSNFEGGEGYDWYYASDADRIAQTRRPIHDGAYNEHWIYRQKDIRSWHGHAHFPRENGVRLTQSTAWSARAKPVRFVEFGCSAVDMGTNQPNVFYDPKSSENALPLYSDGSRDDVIQRRSIEAFLSYWKDDPMIDTHGISLWAWDMRPFPAWPMRGDIWGDGENWQFGHWLNGRVGLALLDDVVLDIAGRSNTGTITSRLNGLVTGYVIDQPMSVRDALEPLRSAFEIRCVERENALHFESIGGVQYELDARNAIETQTGTTFQIGLSTLEQPTRRIRLKYSNSQNDYETGIALSDSAGNEHVMDVNLPLVMDQGAATRFADVLFEKANARRHNLNIQLPFTQMALEAGDVLSVSGEAMEWVVERITCGETIRLEAMSAYNGRLLSKAGSLPAQPPQIVHASEPVIEIVDGPPLPGFEEDLRPMVFASAFPWIGGLRIFAGADESELSERCDISQPAKMGRLLEDLPSGVPDRWMDQSIRVDMRNTNLQSVTELNVLNGANACLVEVEGGWELLQFQMAELVQAGQYRLSHLLRGQQGTENFASRGALAGARVIIVSENPDRLEMKPQDAGLQLLWRAKWTGFDDINGSGEFVWNRSALSSWAPAHLSAERSPNGLRLAWIRRARADGDSWEVAEIPNFANETYRVSIFDDVELKRIWESSVPYTEYIQSDIDADFPNGGVIKIIVQQLNLYAEPGHSAILSYQI